MRDIWSKSHLLPCISDLQVEGTYLEATYTAKLREKFGARF